MSSVGVTSVDVARRFIELERCANFRDLGGYEAGDGRRVRWGRVYRSMTPEYISESDQEVARGLGIGLVVDLRGPQFKTSGPLGKPPARRLAPGRQTVLMRNEIERDAYIDMAPAEALQVVLARMGRIYARTATSIARAGCPALVHCRLGKDRTGVFSAVLLKLLGVDDAVVIEDYLLSARFMERANRILDELEPQDMAGRHSRVATEPPHPESIRAVLRLLENRYEGAEGYLRLHGMTRRDVRALVDGLLE